MFSKNHPHLTVDVIVPDVHGRIILLERGHQPFKGLWCLPGGMVDPGETVERAAVREVQEEIGIQVTIARVLAIHSMPGRDPRGDYISIVLVAHPTAEQPQETEEATALLHAHPGTDVPMAFDHTVIMQEYWASLKEEQPVLLR